MRSITRYFVLLLSLIGALPAAVPSAIYNVLEHGAVPDGKTKNTAALQKTIATIGAAGGGTLWFPAGKYLTGSLSLESNLTLHLEPGAELLYSGDAADSPLVQSRWECTNAFTHAPLIYANGKTNLAITGRGTINGVGKNWWWRNTRQDPARREEALPAVEAWRKLYTRIEAGEKLTKEDFTVAAGYLRPSLVVFYECKNILVEGVTITDSPMWLLHPIYSDDIVVRGVRFISDGPNGDGIDVDSCRNVRISDCFFTTGDDCIVIKSGRDNDGRRTARPTEYVTITNCVMYKGHGAVVIGSETSGGIRNITASNCIAKGTDRGIRIKTQRGRGGVLENFRFDNWVIEDARIQAFEITSRYGRTADEPVSERTPTLRNISYSNITVINAKKVASIEGLPERAIEQLRFTDINATGETGFIVDNVSDVELHHVRVTATKGSAFQVVTGNSLVFDDVSPRTEEKGAPGIALTDCSDVFLRNSRAAAGTGTFLKLDGAKTSGIILADNEVTRAAEVVKTGADVAPSAVAGR
ncbi:MAG TPA: glycoside hydrolase family 28 protein [Opitutaceae bacterium]|nr:glycoside hydrolase family 28 protein [Opitutaceae bacterium]